MSNRPARLEMSGQAIMMVSTVIADKYIGSSSYKKKSDNNHPWGWPTTPSLPSINNLDTTSFRIHFCPWIHLARAEEVEVLSPVDAASKTYYLRRTASIILLMKD